MKHLKLFEAFSQEEQVEKANNLFIEFLTITNLIKNCYIKKIKEGRYHIFYKPSIFILNVFEADGRAWMTDDTYRVFRNFICSNMNEDVIWELIFEMFGDNQIWKAIQKFIRLHEENKI